jgi:hypothetical protein
LGKLVELLCKATKGVGHRCRVTIEGQAYCRMAQYRS